ncbi:MAG: hypothetical protein PWQ55_820 [Chloroflexota bacterium]|nr:hypothetical protein [Chloroflexota bacterium]
MAEKKIDLKAILFAVLALAASCAVFFLVSRADLPASWIKAFSRFGWIQFLGLAGLFYLILNVRGKWGLALGGLFSALVFALPLALRLSSGLSNATVLAGFLPYKDGFYYYNGAGMLLSGRLIPAYGLQGAFRPLFPALLSSFLWLSGQNLLLALQCMVLVTGLSLYLSAMAVRRAYGPLPAALYFALTFAFIRPMLGDTLTELPGLAFACLALALLLHAGRTKNIWWAGLGGVMLVLALSIRAGAFFMLPFVILWWGWLQRGDKWRPWKQMVILGLVLVAAFALFNTLLPRVLVAAGESTFGNFSWMLYGQAVGGAGFKYHAEALGTSDSAVVLQAALEKIRTYPQGFLIGCAKAYRDFFTNNSLGMFELISGAHSPGGWLFWGGCLALLVLGTWRAWKARSKAANLLLLAGLLGVLVSIPFLPPIDGGKRFYAGSAPFLFALLAAALPEANLQRRSKPDASEQPAHHPDGLAAGSTGLSILMLVMTALLPLAIMAWSQPSAANVVSCAADQMAFTTTFEKGSYVDILPDEADCGAVPSLCRARFSANGMDRVNDDFYRLLDGMAAQSANGLRLWAGIEQNSQSYYFWIMPLELTENVAGGQPFSGCAQPMESEFQRYLLVDSVSLP